MAAIDMLVRPLARVALFQGLSGQQLAEIARRAERIVYTSGSVLIEKDREGDAAILIVSGEARRVAGPGADGGASVVPEGSLLGEMAMLIETEYSSTVVASGPIRALRFTREEMHALMAQDNSLADHLVHKISGRLSALIAELRAVDLMLADASSEAAPNEHVRSSSGSSGDTAAAPMH